MSPTTKNHRFLEGAQVGLWHRQSIVEASDLLLEERFGLISLGGKRVKRIGEAVVQNGQNRNTLNSSSAC